MHSIRSVMDQSDLSARPLLNDGDDGMRERPKQFPEDSTPFANKDPFTHPLLNEKRIGAHEALGRASYEISLPMTEASTTSRESNSTKRSSCKQLSIQPNKPSRKALHRLDIGRQRCVWALSRIWRGSWTTESCSYFASILALAGLVTTLLAHQSRPLPQWPRLVTINSIISLFSLLMRACIGVVLAEGISQCKWSWYRQAKRLDHFERLDSASRGSWGSLNLLFHFRPKQAHYLAALGAIITIMSSLTGFFLQQIVQFKDCLQEDTFALANISRTNFYTQTGGYMMDSAPFEFVPMVGAINVGAFQSPGDLTGVLSSGCSSGNCTFSDVDTPAFSTLAISHLCQNVTAHTRFLNETNATATGYTVSYPGSQSDRNGTLTFANSTGHSFWSWTDTSSDSSDLIAIYFLLTSSSKEQDWNATRCSLFPTTNTYKATIKDAILEEKLVDSVRLKSIIGQFDPPLVYDADYESLISTWSNRMITEYTTRNGIRASCEGSEDSEVGYTQFLKRSDELTYVNSTGHTNPSAGWKWWYHPRGCDWAMYKGSATTLVRTLTEVFDHKNITMDSTKRMTEGAAYLRVLLQDDDDQSGGDIVEDVAVSTSFDSINKRMEGLAVSMTAIIRTNGVSRDNLKGTVWINTTCMYIRWAWITFPAVMIGLTGIFLMLIAYENLDIETDRLWKSSFLAALFCEVEVHDKPVGKEGMKAMARSMSVSLEDRRATLRLVAG